METTGERIKRYREASGMTQEDLANKINTSPQNIYKYEKDIIRNIPLDKIRALSDVFNITPAQLVGWGADSHTNLHHPSLRNTPDAIGDLSDTEKSIIIAYRKNPDCHVAVQRILGIEQTAIESTLRPPTLKLAQTLPPYRFRNDKTDKE